jgi:CheY-like chemotaxis protein
MSRILLVHWNAAEARERAARLRRWGHRVSVAPTDGPALLAAAASDPPQAFVIDLGRLPSHGRAVAVEWRRRKTTRAIPLVFLDGERERVSRVRALLPDAVYASWGKARTAIVRAILRPPSDPVVPASDSGPASGVTLAKKLGIRPGFRVALLDAPAGVERVIGAVPEGATLRRGAMGARDLAILFVESHAALRRRAADLATLAGTRTLWICWPKQGGPLAGDLTQNSVRAAAMDRGLVDYKICAFDDAWSGLAFVVRRKTKRRSPA